MSTKCVSNFVLRTVLVQCYTSLQFITGAQGRPKYCAWDLCPTPMFQSSPLLFRQLASSFQDLSSPSWYRCLLPQYVCGAPALLLAGLLPECRDDPWQSGKPRQRNKELTTRPSAAALNRRSSTTPHPTSSQRTFCAGLVQLDKGPSTAC